MSALFNPLSFIPAPWLIWIRVGLYLACFAAGVWVSQKFHDADLVRAVNEARATERDTVVIGNQAESGYLDRMRKMKESGDAKLEDLRKRNAKRPRCDVSVPADWLREPAAGVSSFAGNAAGPQPAGAQVDPVADCRDVVQTCERNRLEVCEPNAVQLDAVIGWYASVRKRMNGR